MEPTSGDDPGREKSYSTAQASRFNFKSKSGRSSKRHKPHHDDTHEGDDRNSRRRRKHKHRSSATDYNRYGTSTRDGAYYDPDSRRRESLLDDREENEAASPGLAPDDAFRESLFDALADDEGAAYWEGVYGQPVHVYPDTKAGPDGKLERMTEDEYTDYVRTKMWEKSHQHILEEREAKEKARKERKKARQNAEQETFREEQDREQIRRQMEESLRRGAERKKAKEAVMGWERYTEKWAELKIATQTAQDDGVKVSEIIPWPVISGCAKHVTKEEIEIFLRACPTWKEDPIALLKLERVRWHPDKMQQRFGHHLDTDSMAKVTAVFQVVDRLLNERR